MNKGVKIINEVFLDEFKQEPVISGNKNLPKFKFHLKHIVMT